MPYEMVVKSSLYWLENTRIATTTNAHFKENMSHKLEIIKIDPVTI